MNIEDTIFTIVDTETTGLDPAKGDALVEVAAYAWNLKVGFIGQPFSTLVNPNRDIPPVVSAIHHLTARDLVDAPAPPEALELLRRYVTHGSVIVAHNAPFDHGFLPSLHTTHDGQPQLWLCTSRLAKHVFPEAPAHGNQVLRYWLPDPIFDGDPRLLGLNPHRALADVIVTGSNLGHLLRAYLEHFEGVFADAYRAEHGPGYDATPAATLVPPADTPSSPHPRPYDNPAELISFADSPITLKTVHFGKHRGALWTAVPSDYLRWMLTQATDMDPDVINTAKQILVGRLPARAQAPV